MWCGRQSCQIAVTTSRRRFTREAGLKPRHSCRRAGTWYRERGTCGLRSRPFVAVQSIALSAPFGELMGSSLANVPQTVVIEEIVQLRRLVFRFIALADDNF